MAEVITKEITFQSTCGICGRKDAPCRRHHLIPRRLLKILSNRKRKKWNKKTVIACSKCNRFLHPENMLYKQIIALKNQLETTNRKV